jgi:hypothetical protein
MTEQPTSTLGRDSQLYARYSESAAVRLEDDPAFREARTRWARFVRNSHGNVFEGVDRSDARDSDAAPDRDAVDRLFVDSLYYDFVVDRLRRAAEREFGFRLANPEAGANTSALPVDFGALHRRVTAGFDAGPGSIGDRFGRSELLAADVDLLRELHSDVLPRELRLALGEYYTPKGVAALGVAELDVGDVRREAFLDPGCGSGAFLAACIERKVEALAGEGGPVVAGDPDAPDDGWTGRDGGLDAESVVECVTDTVYGIDLNPIAVRSAKLAYVLSLLPVLDRAAEPTVEVPVFLTDALGLTRDDELTYGEEPFDPTADHLVGNPPWITWSELPERVKRAWREADADLDLLPHRGAASRLGFANDDVSLPFVWVSLRRHLAAGGDASFVLKRSVMKGPAGGLLRSGRVGDRPVAVRKIHDFGDLRPFGGDVRAGAALYTLSTDGSPEFPIPTTTWTASDGRSEDRDRDRGRDRTRDRIDPDYGSLDAMTDSLRREETGTVPVEPDDPASAWVRTDAERRALGDCTHEIRHGVKDDATDVYTIERDRLTEIEPGLVYPYLKSRHVVKYGLFGHDLRLVPMERAGEENEAELRDRYPETYRYLQGHRDRLDDRASAWLDDGPFYSVFGLGAYTWAPYKIVWCRLGFKPHFAVVSTVEDEDLGEKPIVPGDHCMFVSTDDEREAHFLCALLNSAPYQRSIRAVASEGKASLSKTAVSKLALPEYRETTASGRLAELSMAAHEIVPEHTDVSKRAYNRRTIDELAAIQAEIDETVEGMLAGEDGLLSEAGAGTRSESE